MEQNQKILTLYPNKIKTFFYLVISSAFVYIGMTRLLQNDNSALNWTGIIFFSIGCIIFVINLVPGSSYLQLSETGFTIKSLFKKSFTSWDDVQIFKTGRTGSRILLKPSKKVVFDFSPKVTKGVLGRNLAKSLAGHEGMLPDTYGKGAENLAKLLNEWREKYTVR